MSEKLKREAGLPELEVENKAATGNGEGPEVEVVKSGDAATVTELRKRDEGGVPRKDDAVGGAKRDGGVPRQDRAAVGGAKRDEAGVPKKDDAVGGGAKRDGGVPEHDAVVGGGAKQDEGGAPRQDAAVGGGAKRDEGGVPEPDAAVEGGAPDGGTVVPADAQSEDLFCRVKPEEAGLPNWGRTDVPSVPQLPQEFRSFHSLEELQESWGLDDFKIVSVKPSA